MKHEAECELAARLKRAREMGLRTEPVTKELVEARARHSLARTG